MYVPTLVYYNNTLYMNIATEKQPKNKPSLKLTEKLGTSPGSYENINSSRWITFFCKTSQT